MLKLKLIYKLVLVVLALYTSALSQETVLQHPFEIAARAFLDGNDYTEAITNVRSAEEKYKNSEFQDAYWELMGTLSSYMGNYEDALYYFDQISWASQFRDVDSFDESSFTTCTPVSALAAITEQAKTHQVVMINEAHHMPQHRSFIIDLLKSLRSQGFKYLGIETLNSSDTGLNKRGYALVDTTGFYSNEPIFGELIRTAISLDYELVPYEANLEVAETPEDREVGQAENLIKRILENDPDAKFVVLAGYGHIDEMGEEDSTRMAEFFTRESGINPLTVDQTTMTQHSASESEYLAYQYATKTFEFDEPTLFKCGSGFWINPRHQGHYDLMVFSPRSAYILGRPDWATLGGIRKYHELNLDICQDTSPCFVQAHRSGESDQAVPADQIEIKLDEPSPALLLSKGNYIVKVLDNSGEIKSESEVTIE